MSANKSVLAGLTLALLVAGCGGGDHEDLKEWMRDSTKGLKGKVPPLPEVKPYEPVAYDAQGLMDPFKPAKLEPAQKKGGAASSRISIVCESRWNPSRWNR